MGQFIIKNGSDYLPHLILITFFLIMETEKVLKTRKFKKKFILEIINRISKKLSSFLFKGIFSKLFLIKDTKTNFKS